MTGKLAGAAVAVVIGACGPAVPPSARPLPVAAPLLAHGAAPERRQQPPGLSDSSASTPAPVSPLPGPGPSGRAALVYRPAATPAPVPEEAPVRPKPKPVARPEPAAEPTAAAPEPPAVAPLDLETVDLVFFAVNQGTLAGPTDTLDAFARLALSSEDKRLVLVARADADERDPARLSAARGEAVRRYLIRRGVRGHRIVVHVLGADSPRRDRSDTDATGAENRCVELALEPANLR